MKYRELLAFEPITEVVKFDKTGEGKVQESLVKTFVFSDAMKSALLPVMLKNIALDTSDETFGVQVVGNYGTGKSHLMTLVSAIAENKNLLAHVADPVAKKILEPVAGDFKVLRFEIGNAQDLWSVVTFQMDKYFDSIDVDFKFDKNSLETYATQLEVMMSKFESALPNKGFLVVIDEMLSYLKGRSGADKLNTDLQVLQALGQATDRTKFKFMFGVQEMIYQSPEFQFASDMLQKVNNRYRDIQITKDDVKFVVKNRLLRKNEHQKRDIRKHLEPFQKFFEDLHGRTDEYVELFPVHPSYFENFEKIKVGKSQREILKTLSAEFSEILDDEIPSEHPGLLTYDQYWLTMQSSQDILADREVLRVKEIYDIVCDKIDSYFTGGRLAKRDVALRIACASAVKLLQSSLDKQLGTTASQLVDDLCLTNPIAEDRDFLIDVIDSTAQGIITATSGQFFSKKPDGDEYHLRTDEGVNYDQKIADYAASMSNSQKDQYFFEFLQESLPLENAAYRNGFKIWQHSIEWKAHKTYRDGYIFFGHPNEKSTTQPKQHFYMYFMPIFDFENWASTEADSIYYEMTGLSAEYRAELELYGAAVALQASATTDQKPIYKDKIKSHFIKARSYFDKEYLSATKVIYCGDEHPLNGYQLPPEGSTKEQVFSEVASQELGSCFEEAAPNYPKFTSLNTPVNSDNLDRLLKATFTKIDKPNLPNRDAEGILQGLGLWEPGELSHQSSPYARLLLKQIEDKGTGQVLNKDEILECVYPPEQMWVSKNAFQIEAHWQFVVLSVLVALGKIEIKLNTGNTLNANNLGDLKQLDHHDYYSFSHVSLPKGLNMPALKAMFMGLIGIDLTNALREQETYLKLSKKSEEWAKRAAMLEPKIQGGLVSNDVTLVTADEAIGLRTRITAFKGFCDKVSNYTSEAKMRSFPFGPDEVKSILGAKDEIERIENQLTELEKLNTDLHYLQQATQYVLDDSLKEKISVASSKAADMIKSGGKKLEDFKSELQSLKSQYADWYLDQYLKFRISGSDHTKKLALEDSDEMFICNVLNDADFLPSTEFLSILDSLSRLKPADGAVNKERILGAPYQDFNPMDYHGKAVKTMKDLKLGVQDIRVNWEEALKETLEDPTVKKKQELLSDAESDLVNGFKSGDISIDRSNVKKIRDVLMNLHEGLLKVELTMDALQATFNKPLTPEQAMDAFKAYVDQVSAGKDRNKIRIILK